MMARRGEKDISLKGHFEKGRIHFFKNPTLVTPMGSPMVIDPTKRQQELCIIKSFKGKYEVFQSIHCISGFDHGAL